MITENHESNAYFTEEDERASDIDADNNHKFTACDGTHEDERREHVKECLCET